MLVLLFLSLVSFSAAFEPTVITKVGPIRGFTMKTQSGRNINAFTGIPYAKPPVEDLRFKPPVPIESMEFDFSATRTGIRCPQPDLHSTNTRVIGDENCLILNVYSPSLTASLLPVLFWIHGGFFIVGSSDPKDYGPEKLLEKNVVLVTINYRLGALGFLSTGDRLIRGNMGLMDQNLALKWVRDHIINFGGNPENVILFGEDAGGASAILHMVSPLSEGLFHGVIAQSGSPFAQHFVQRYPWVASVKLVQLLKCDILGEMFLLACLLNVPAEEIVEKTMNLGLWRGFPPKFAPVLENVTDEFILNDPVVSFRSGNFYRVPVITGVSKDEAGLLPHFLKLLHAPKSYNQVWFQTFIDKKFPLIARLPSEEALSRIKHEYFSIDMTTEATAYDALKQCFADYYFNAPALRLIRLLKRYVPVFMYVFAYRGSTWIGKEYDFDQSNGSAAHADETLYLFGDKLTTSSDLDVSKTIVDLWFNFAVYGEPTPYPQPVKWNAIIPIHFEYLLLDNGKPKIVTEEYRTDKGRFWNVVLNRLRIKAAKENAKKLAIPTKSFISKTLPNFTAMIITGIKSKGKTAMNLSSESKGREPIGPSILSPSKNTN